MDVNAVRKANIRRLVNQMGSIKAFADKTDTNASYVSSALSVKIGRNFGDQFMRQVERAFELEPGSLDFPEDASMDDALAIQVLPEAMRREVRDYIRYKLQTAGELVANQPAAADYLKKSTPPRPEAGKRRKPSN